MKIDLSGIVKREKGGIKLGKKGDNDIKRENWSSVRVRN